MTHGPPPLDQNGCSIVGLRQHLSEISAKIYLLHCTGKANPRLAWLSRQILEQHPRLRATRIYHMIRDRDYSGQRRAVTGLRFRVRKPFLRLHTLASEQAQVDCAHLGQVPIGPAQRALSCFVITLAYSRVLYLELRKGLANASPKL